jgi:SsrA-binding protein
MSAEIRKILQHRRARHEYTISETFEAGIVLVGTEVKSLRAGQGNLSDAFVTIENGEAWLRQAFIPEYTFGNRFNHEPKRPRKLLLHAQEIHKLHAKIKEKGFSAVPLSMYFRGAKVKVEFGLGKGKQLHDKRQAEKEKTAKREIREHY